MITNSTVEDIANEVSQHYLVKIDDLFENTRRREVADKRSVFFYFAYKYSGATLTEIGRFPMLYQRDKPYNHATVIHSFRKINELKQFDKEIAADVQALDHRIVMNVVSKKEMLADSFYKRQEIIHDLYEMRDVEYVQTVYQLLKMMNADCNPSRVEKTIDFYQDLYTEENERVHQIT